MSIAKYVFVGLSAFLAGSLPAVAQTSGPANPTPIHLSVVVNAKSGQSVPNLSQQDFTILDPKSPQPITSFRVFTAAQEPVSVILFVDSVNTPYELLGAVRDQTEKFLRKKEGVLAYPTSLAVLTDDGLQIPKKFSSNGMELSDDLEHREIGLHRIILTNEFSAGDRLTICIKALHQLTQVASRLPGRKIILWISPGFPLASGPGYASLTPMAERAIFGDVTFFSNELRQDNITLYNINPVGASQSTFDANYYQTFLKGVTRPDDAQLADLSVQVLSIQTGGLALVSNNDVAGMIQRCIADANSWYEIEFTPRPGDKPNQYHAIDVRLDQPGLIARTRTGYYANPQGVNPPR